jgi:hypothetical protein
MMHINKPFIPANILIAIMIGLLACLFPFTSASAHTLAGGNGHIYGQLLDGSNNNAPLAGQKVTLQIAQGANAGDLTTVTTDAHGGYDFPGLATDKTISYAVYIRYQGAQYVSDVVSLDSKPTQQLNLTVYGATSDTSKVAIVQATVLVHEPDRKNGSFTVSEFFAFKNLDTRAFVGSLDTSQGRPKALFFSLPQGAHNVNLSNGFDGYHSIQVNGGFASDAALLPGDSEFAFSFEVPYHASTYNFAYQTMYPTVALSFMVPPDVHVSPDSLKSSGVVTADQHPYQLFKTSALPAKQNVTVKLEGLPVATTTPSTGAPSSLNTTSIWLLVGLLALMAIIVVSTAIYRLTAKRAGGKPQHKGSAGGAKQGKAAATKATKPARTAETTVTDERQKALLHELLELDKAHEAGKLSKAVYEERRARTKARLRTLMSESEREKEHAHIGEGRAKQAKREKSRR